MASFHNLLSDNFKKFHERSSILKIFVNFEGDQQK